MRMNNAEILVLGDRGYALYLGELLNLEGWKTWTCCAEAELGDSLEQGVGVLLVPSGSYLPPTIEALERFASIGGLVVLFHPTPALSDLGSILATAKPKDSPYVKIGGQALQTHGEAGTFALVPDKTTVEAWFCDKDGQDTVIPAIWTRTLGQGSVVVFAYDLPRSIHLTRQGNFELAGQDTDGIPGVRPMDMFVGGWVDPSKNLLNQADAQLRFLSSLLARHWASRVPVPRLGYFPNGARACVVLSNDSEYSTGDQLGTQLDEVRDAGGRMTVYLFDTSQVSRAQVEAWVAEGHEMAAHPGFLDGAQQDAYAKNPTWSQAEERVRGKVEEIKHLYGQKSTTMVHHWFVWCGLDLAGSPDPVAMARIFEAQGIGMESHFVHYDGADSPQQGFLGGRQWFGNFTGSGLPLKLADEDGTPLGVYQLINNVYDQLYTEAHDPQGFFRCFQTILDASLDGRAPSWIHVKAHNDEWWFSREPILKMLAYARERNIAVITMQKCLEFSQARDDARFESLTWDGAVLEFEVASRVTASSQLPLELPALWSGRRCTEVLMDGVAQPSLTVLLLSPGTRHSIRARYQP